MRGLMQDWPMSLHRIIDYGAQYHVGAKIVSRDGKGTTRLRYSDIRRRALKLASALSRSDIGTGDRVAILAWNTHRHLEAWYGIAGTGGIYHTLNPRLFPEQLAWIANHGGARILMYDASLAELVKTIAPRLKHIRLFVCLGEDVVPSDLGRPTVSYEEFIAEDRDFSWVTVNENQACGLCYTSGTTGQPKGVLYSHRSNILTSLFALLTPGLKMGPGDVVLPVVPLFHANGWTLPFIAPLSGASLVLPGNQLDSASLYQLMEDEQVSISAAVPTVWANFLTFLEAHDLKLKYLKRICVGGSAIPRTIVERFERIHGIEVIHAWGMTEMSPLGSFSALKPPLDLMSEEEQIGIKVKQGYPVFGVEMKITSDSGEERPRDGKSVGRIKVRGPNVARAYFKGSGREAFDRDGWFDTGDVGTLDCNGYMQIVDRAKDVIKSGGEWISSVEIENLVVGHPDVAEAAVIGTPHPKWGERPLLIIVPRAGKRPDLQCLKDYLKDRIAKWWMPDKIVLVEEIPYSATGKIAKTELRRRYAGNEEHTAL